MDVVVTSLVAFVALAVGVVVAWVLLKPRVERAETILAERENELKAKVQEAQTAQVEKAEAVARAERVVTLEAEKKGLEELRDGLQTELSAAMGRIASLETGLTAAEIRLKEGIDDRTQASYREKQDLQHAYEQLLKQEREATQLRLDEAQAQFDERRKELQALVDGLREELDAARQQMKETFTAVSAEVLKQNNEAFLHTANQVLEKHTKESEGQLKQREEAIKGLVKPLDEKLGEYDKFLKDFQERNAEQSGKTAEQLGALLNQLETQRQSTQDLKEMLRGPSARGRLGEMYLKRMLDDAGLVENIHYQLQFSEVVDGVRARPDCLVHLPGKKCIVIDAKVPLNYYEQALQLDDEIARTNKLKEHAAAVRKHVNDLISRPYQAIEQPVEIVVMYLPLEASLSAALQVDPEIHSFGWNKGVAVCSPTLLYFLLRMAARDWRQADLERNAKEIAKLGEEMVNRIRVVAEHLSKVGDALGKSVKSYNDAQASLERNLLTQAQKFQKLGAGRGMKLKALPELDASPKPFTKAELRSLPDPETVARFSGEEFVESDIVESDEDLVLNED